VDEQNSILLRYRDGVTANLYSTMLANTDRRGVIYGTNGYLAVDNINNPARVDVYDGKCALTETFFAPAQISGYEYQVEASKKAIVAGKIECEEMPHEETLSIMRIVHKLRKSWGSL
jgi:predicted dehydrogenase